MIQVFKIMLFQNCNDNIAFGWVMDTKIMLFQHCIDKIAFGWVMHRRKNRKDINFLGVFGWVGKKMKILKKNI